jgi:hypothetical protein
MDAAAAGMSEILRPRLLDIDHEHPPDIAALTPLAPDATIKRPQLSALSW